MLEFAKKHLFILLPALVIGILIFVPTFLSVKNAGENFEGIYPMFNDDEAYYLATAEEVFDGRHNQDLSLQQSLLEIIIASEARLLGSSIPTVAVINDFLLPFLGVILLYALIFDLTKSRKISYIFSFLFYFIFLSYFNRPTNPQFSFLPFLLALLLVYKIVSQKYDSKKIIILNISLGLVFGSLFYIYPFYWTTTLVLYAVGTITLALSQKEFQYWIKNWFVFGLTSALVALPYLFNLLRSIKNSSFLETSIRQGMVFNHYPAAFFNVALMFGCILLIYIIRKNITDKRLLVFMYSLPISGIVLNWQNVITGKYLQFSSHYYQPIILFAFLIIAILLKTNPKKFGATCLVVMMMAIIIYKQKDDIRGAYLNIISPADISSLQNLASVANWLNTNTPKDSAVYTLGEELNEFLPVYTHDNVYWHYYENMQLISDEESENRWVLQNIFENIDADFIRSHQAEIWLTKFTASYQNQAVRQKILGFMTGEEYSEPDLVDQKYIDRVLEKYQYFKKIGFEKSLRTYAADYIVLDIDDERYKKLVVELEKSNSFKLKAELGKILVFELE